MKNKKKRLKTKKEKNREGKNYMQSYGECVQML